MGIYLQYFSPSSSHFFSVIGATVSLNPKGFKNRFSVSCVGLFLGLIALEILGAAIFTIFANSFNP